MEFHVGPAGWWHLALFGIVLPAAAVRSKRRLDERPLPPRANYYASVVLQQLVFLTLSVLVARSEWIPLWPARLPAVWAWAMGAGITVALVLAMRPQWKAAVARRERRTLLLMPANRRERLLWAAVSLGAGIGEEITYRGVMYVLLWRLTGSVPAAALVAAAVFAVSHWLQGAKSMLIIFGFSLLFQGIAYSTGSLLVGMAVHFAYDLVAGLSYARFGREMIED